MLGMLLALMLQGEAAAAPPITQPEWLRLPASSEFARYYPPGAAARGIAGRATLKCTVNRDGILIDCQAIEESPPGEGFGDAAVKMARLFRMRSATKGGQSVEGGTIKIPIRFELPAPGTDALAATFKCYGRTAVAADSTTPPSPEAWNAARVWLGQALLLTSQSSGQLSSLEDRLRQAHVAAQAENDPRVKPTLAECMAAVKDAMQPASK